MSRVDWARLEEIHREHVAGGLAEVTVDYDEAVIELHKRVKVLEEKDRNPLLGAPCTCDTAGKHDPGCPMFRGSSQTSDLRTRVDMFIAWLNTAKPDYLLSQRRILDKLYELGIVEK